MKYGYYLYFGTPIPQSDNWNPLNEGTTLKKANTSRIAMIKLALQDCGLDNQNVFVKEYEKDCLYSLYPNFDTTKEGVSVIL